MTSPADTHLYPCFIISCTQANKYTVLSICWQYCEKKRDSTRDYNLPIPLVWAIFRIRFPQRNRTLDIKHSCEMFTPDSDYVKNSHFYMSDTKLTGVYVNGGCTV